MLVLTQILFGLLNKILQRILQSSAEFSAEIHKIYWEKSWIILIDLYSNNFKKMKLLRLGVIIVNGQIELDKIEICIAITAVWVTVTPITVINE